MANANSYRGSTTIAAGAIALSNGNAIANSTLSVGSNNGLLFNTNGGAIAAFNVGALAGNGNIALADGAFAVTLAVGGNGAATSYNGVMSGAGGLTVSGGLLDLASTNSYSGATSLVASQLLLDFSLPGAPAANIVNSLANSSSLALGGGTLALQGISNTANNQRFNGLTINPGASSVILSAGTSNSVLVSLGSINRGAGGTIDFSLPSGTQSASNGVTTATSNNAAGILGAYATVAGANWACSTGSAGNIVAYQAYTGGDLGSISSGSSLNISPTGS